MRRYGRIQGLLLSLGLPSFYHDVARNWGGVGFLYLVLVLTLTWIPVLITWHIRLNTAIEEELPKFLKDVPPITIKNGKVSSPVEQPYKIVDKKDNNKTIFVLDTTGEINSLDQTDALFLLTATKMHQRDPNTGKIQIHDLTPVQDFSLDGDKIQEWAETYGKWVAPLAYPFVMIGSLIRALIIILIAAIVGLIFNLAFGAGVSFFGLMRMGAVGLTLSYYIDTALMLTNNVVPFWFLIALALTTLYVIYGVKCAGVPEPEQPTREYPWEKERQPEASDFSDWRER